MKRTLSSPTIHFFIFTLLFTTAVLGNKELPSTEHYLVEGTKHKHHFLTIKDQEKKNIFLGVHTYLKKPSKKLLTLIHGYAESCSYNKVIISHFLNKGFEVQCIEMPGHGTSDGARYEIDSFHTYKSMIKEVLKHLSKRKLHYFLSHSTGSVGFTQHLKEKHLNPFQKVIFLAPLTRNAYWNLARPAAFILSPFINRVGRLNHKRDPDYFLAKKSDPKYYDYLPLQWFRELTKYYDSLSHKTISQTKNFLIIYGTDDEVIDWKNSLQFHKTWFPEAQFKTIEKGTHHLFFNSDMIRSNLFKTIDQFISGT